MGFSGNDFDAGDGVFSSSPESSGWSVTPNQTEDTEFNSSGWSNSDGFDEGEFVSFADEEYSPQGSFSSINSFSGDIEPQEQFEEIHDTDLDPKPPKEFHFSHATVGVMLFVLFVVIAIALQTCNGIKITKNDNQQQIVSSQPQQGTLQPASGVDQAVLVKIPDKTKLDYSGEVFTATGTVTSKDKYLNGKQVVYCLNISLTFGSYTETVAYYCTYQTYNEIDIGKQIDVYYQQVDDGYISVRTVSVKGN